MRRALVADKAGFTTVQEVESMTDVNLVVLGLNPGQLVDHLVSPFVHALVSHMHLGVQNPQEAETFDGQMLYWDVYNFLVAHRLVLEVEFVV